MIPMHDLNIPMHGPMYTCKQVCSCLPFVFWRSYRWSQRRLFNHCQTLRDAFMGICREAPLFFPWVMPPLDALTYGCDALFLRGVSADSSVVCWHDGCPTNSGLVHCQSPWYPSAYMVNPAQIEGPPLGVFARNQNRSPHPFKAISLRTSQRVPKSKPPPLGLPGR